MSMKSHYQAKRLNPKDPMIKVEIEDYFIPKTNNETVDRFIKLFFFEVPIQLLGILWVGFLYILGLYFAFYVSFSFLYWLGLFR